MPVGFGPQEQSKVILTLLKKDPLDVTCGRLSSEKYLEGEESVVV